jgi:xylulose-5-phosphate/fructose-6-phosphate phosphoketolase
VYAHLNRLIIERDARVLLVVGPGHGAPAILANLFLEGTLADVYPGLARTEAGVAELVERFSWPGGFASHLTPAVPGMIHEGGELGYSLFHAYGAAFDNPDLLVACVIGDGEAETGAIAAGWHSNKFLNPQTSGAVLPVLHLNGYKLAGPSFLARVPDRELDALIEGYGYRVLRVEGDDPFPVHATLRDALDAAYDEICAIQQRWRSGNDRARPIWPMIVLRTPKGWTAPRELDGKPLAGSFLSHQIPIEDPAHNPEHLRALEAWLRSYRPEQLFDASGAPHADLIATTPQGERRIGASPHGNGGSLLQPLDLPALDPYAVAVSAPGASDAEATRAVAPYLRDIMQRNAVAQNVRVMCPDEITSNRLDGLFDVTQRAWLEPQQRGDEHLAVDGRIMEILNEQACEGWLEGYVLTGRHGVFATYEAFVMIAQSMAGLHAKWLKMASEVPWRKPIASLNYLLTSHVWRQDQDGYSHQGPGFVNALLTKKREFMRAYYACDGNTLLAVMETCLTSRNRINVITAGKHPAPQWLDLSAARKHVADGASVWPWAGSNVADGEPDIVIAAAGDVPTIETLAAVTLLRNRVPQLRIRVVNVVDLLRLDPQHPEGFDRDVFATLFTETAPVIFAFHGYPGAVHELLYKRPHPERFHVHGYIEEGTTTTPFDMTVLNGLSRFQLAIAAVRYTCPGDVAAAAVGAWNACLKVHASYIAARGEDLPEITSWRWTSAT